MKKVILIGNTGCGKTTLCQRIHEQQLEYKKTQSVEFYDYAIDTPGEYLENKNYYSALIVSSADADIIALVADCTANESYIPPSFAGIFAKEVIGIITKIAAAQKEEDIEDAEIKLRMAGVSKVFKIDSVKDIGIKQLVAYLDQSNNYAVEKEEES